MNNKNIKKIVLLFVFSILMSLSSIPTFAGTTYSASSSVPNVNSTLIDAAEDSTMCTFSISKGSSKYTPYIFNPTYLIGTDEGYITSTIYNTASDSMTIRVLVYNASTGDREGYKNITIAAGKYGYYSLDGLDRNSTYYIQIMNKGSYRAVGKIDIY